MTVNDDSRHYGKTALLNWFKAACKDRKLDVVALTPDEIPNRAALIAALSPRTWMSKLLPRKVGVAAVADFNQHRRMTDLVKHAGTCMDLMTAEELQAQRRQE